MVSGTLSLPSRGTFHHSLTVLNPLSVIRKYLALPGGPGRFTRNSTSSVLLGHIHTANSQRFVYGTLTHSGPVSHQVRLHQHVHRPAMLDRTTYTPQHPASKTSTLDTDKV